MHFSANTTLPTCEGTGQHTIATKASGIQQQTDCSAKLFQTLAYIQNRGVRMQTTWILSCATTKGDWDWWARTTGLSPKAQQSLDENVEQPLVEPFMLHGTQCQLKHPHQHFADGGTGITRKKLKRKPRKTTASGGGLAALAAGWAACHTRVTTACMFDDFNNHQQLLTQASAARTTDAIALQTSKDTEWLVNPTVTEHIIANADLGIAPALSMGTKIVAHMLGRSLRNGKTSKQHDVQTDTGARHALSRMCEECPVRQHDAVRDMSAGRCKQPNRDDANAETYVSHRDKDRCDHGISYADQNNKQIACHSIAMMSPLLVQAPGKTCRIQQVVRNLYTIILTILAHGAGQPHHKSPEDTTRQPRGECGALFSDHYHLPNYTNMHHAYMSCAQLVDYRRYRQPGNPCATKNVADTAPRRQKLASMPVHGDRLQQHHPAHAKAKAASGTSRLFVGATRALQPGQRDPALHAGNRITTTASACRTLVTETRDGTVRVWDPRISALATEVPSTTPTSPKERMTAPVDDDTEPIEPGALSEALQSDLREEGMEELTGLLSLTKVTTRRALATIDDRHFRQVCATARAAQADPGLLAMLRAHRLTLKEEAVAAADTESKAERSEAAEKGLLAIAARATRELAAELLNRENPAKERMAAAYHKLHAYISKNEEDRHAGARAAAAAYDEHRAAMLNCPPEMEESLKDAAVAVRDALVLSSLSISGYRDRDLFAIAMEDAFCRVLDDEKVVSQLHNAYSHLMENVPGHFTSRSKQRTRRARQRVTRDIEVEPEPEQTNEEIPGALSTRRLTSTAPTTGLMTALTTTPMIYIPPPQPAYASQMLAPGFSAEIRSGGYGSAPGDWSHPAYHGYTDFGPEPAAYAQESFVELEPNQAIKDAFNNAMIRRLIGDHWYDAQVTIIHQRLGTDERCYTVRYQDGATEILQDYHVQQGMRDLYDPLPSQPDPNTFREYQMKQELAGKITGMLMEMDDDELLTLPRQLQQKVDEATRGLSSKMHGGAANQPTAIASAASTIQEQLSESSTSRSPTEAQTHAYQALQIYLRERRASIPSERAAESERQRLRHNGCPLHFDPDEDCTHCRLVKQYRDEQHAGTNKASTLKKADEGKRRWKKTRFCMSCIHENTDDTSLQQEGIEDEPPNDTSELEKCLAAAQKEALRLRAAIETPVATGRGYGISPVLNSNSG